MAPLVTDSFRTNRSESVVNTHFFFFPKDISWSEALDRRIEEFTILCATNRTCHVQFRKEKEEKINKLLSKSR